VAAAVFSTWRRATIGRHKAISVIYTAVMRILVAGFAQRSSSAQEPPHLTHDDSLLPWVVDERPMRRVMQFDDASVSHVTAEMLSLLRLKWPPVLFVRHHALNIRWRETE
jgi:hypothetical protein